MDRGIEAVIISHREIDKKIIKEIRAGLYKDRCPAELIKREVKRLYPFYWIEKVMWN